MKIEKKIHQIWVGDKPKPKKWMDTWVEKHPEWDYTLWDNERIKELDIKNKEQFEMYWDRKCWHGVADIIRYEILYEFGGFMPGADSECLIPIDELFEDNKELYAVCTSAEVKDWAREDGKEMDHLPVFLRKYDKQRIAPIYAGKKGNSFLDILIKEISLIKEFGAPWKTTGNELCTTLVKKHNPDITIWPKHYFIPTHPKTAGSRIITKYIGKDKIYAKHFWGTTRNVYHEGL